MAGISTWQRRRPMLTQYIRDVLVKHEAKLVVKGKSITSEEIG